MNTQETKILFWALGLVSWFLYLFVYILYLEPRIRRWIGKKMNLDLRQDWRFTGWAPWYSVEKVSFGTLFKIGVLQWSFALPAILLPLLGIILIGLKYFNFI